MVFVQFGFRQPHRIDRKHDAENAPGFQVHRRYGEGERLSLSVPLESTWRSAIPRLVHARHLDSRPKRSESASALSQLNFRVGQDLDRVWLRRLGSRRNLHCAMIAVRTGIMYDCSLRKTTAEQWKMLAWGEICELERSNRNPRSCVQTHLSPLLFWRLSRQKSSRGSASFCVPQPGVTPASLSLVGFTPGYMSPLLRS